MRRVPTVEVIRGSIAAAGARRLVAAATRDRCADVEGEICYPYHSFSADCLVPTLAGKKMLSLACLVDAINGLGATAGPFSVAAEPVATQDILVQEVGGETAAGIAQRTIVDHLGRKLRSIAHFDVNLTSRGLIYKRFFIVRCATAKMMVDSTTGLMHPLHREVA